MWLMASVSVSSLGSELFPLRGRGRGIRTQKVVTVPTYPLIHLSPYLSRHNFANTTLRYTDFLGQTVLRDPHRLQEFLQ